MLWAQLGAVRFETLDAPTSMQHSRETVFAEHPVIGGKPRLQLTGQGLEDRTLGIRVHPSLGDVQPRIDALEAARTAGTALPFVLGSGRVIGQYVITKIEQDTQTTTANGETLEATLTLTLREWNAAVSVGQSSAVKSSAKPAAVTTAPAVARNTAAPTTEVAFPSGGRKPSDPPAVPTNEITRWPWR